METDLAQLPKSARDSLQRELRSGEVLYWAAPYGSPAPSVLRAAFLWVGLVWCIGIGHMSIILKDGWSVWALCSLLLPLGISCLAYTKWRGYKRTVCMLSNHRVAWLLPGQGCVRSLPLTQNMIGSVVMRRGSAGDIVFATAAE